MMLEELGFDSFFEEQCKRLGVDLDSIARVTAEYKESYRVRNSGGEFLAKVTGKHMFQAAAREDYPAAGDWVEIRKVDEGQALIHQILPRKTILKRKSAYSNDEQVIAANIDESFIVQAVERDFNLNRLERYFSIVIAGKIKPVILLNKIDLINQAELASLVARIEERFNHPSILNTSITPEHGIEELRNYLMKGKTYCFLGSSGVGKSSLINLLYGSEILKTKTISDFTQKGRHMTTTRELIMLENGSIVIDNPGMREVGMLEASGGIEELFSDIEAIAMKCKYPDCTHGSEPGCAIQGAIRAGELDQKRWESYLKLTAEDEFQEMTKAERRERERNKGKYYKKVSERLKKSNPKY